MLLLEMAIKKKQISFLEANSILKTGHSTLNFMLDTEKLIN